MLAKLEPMVPGRANWRSVLGRPDEGRGDDTLGERKLEHDPGWSMGDGSGGIWSVLVGWRLLPLWEWPRYRWWLPADEDISA
jgi:hypothetical protein